MKSKGDLIVGFCVLLLGTGALMANSNWQGTYTPETCRFCVFTNGRIYDSDGELIGFWSGRFPAYDDALATGEWQLEEGEHGTWSGWSY